MGLEALTGRLRARVVEVYERNIDEHYRAWIRARLEIDGEMSSDSWRYFQIADGEGAAVPYHYRWLLPRLLGSDRHRWALSTNAALVALLPAMRLYSGNWTSGALLLALPGIRMQRRYPALVDVQAMLLAVLSAAAVKRGQWGLGAVLSLVAGATKESAPIFAAAYSWSPVPLVGLLAVAWRHRVPPGEDVIEDFSHQALVNPWGSAWLRHHETLDDPKVWVAPWGAALAGWTPDRQTMVALALAYGQCLRAVDRARLFQWAGPLVAARAVENLPPGAQVPAVLATWFNPWGGDGG